MFWYLIPLLVVFSFNSAMAFTPYFSRRLGERGGRLVCIVVRGVLGIPVWVIGYILAARAPSTLFFNRAVISSTLGWLLILAGAAIIFIGLLSLRWRAATPSGQDTLVRGGVCVHIRPPLL